MSKILLLSLLLLLAATVGHASIGDWLKKTADKSLQKLIRGCSCSDWGAWSGACSQECGGCGTQTRKRASNHCNSCPVAESKRCNLKACSSKYFLAHNSELHALNRGGCCVGLRRNKDGQCQETVVSKLVGPLGPVIKLPDNPFG